MPEKPPECLHCAISAMINAWSEAYHDNEAPGVAVLAACERVVADLIW